MDRDNRNEKNLAADLASLPAHLREFAKNIQLDDWIESSEQQKSGQDISAQDLLELRQLLFGISIRMPIGQQQIGTATFADEVFSYTLEGKNVGVVINLISQDLQPGRMQVNALDLNTQRDLNLSRFDLSLFSTQGVEIIADAYYCFIYFEPLTAGEIYTFGDSLKKQK